MATLGGVRSDEETAEMLGLALAHWDCHGFGWWMLREPETRELVGRGGLRRLQVGGREEIEIGYALLPGYWGRGLATEVARTSARVGFETLRCTELVAFATPSNRASRRVMEKTGLRYERDIVYAELPHVLYRLRATEWRGESS
jgi:ribosomal-protein-alanine N-acetyltransferase